MFKLVAHTCMLVLLICFSACQSVVYVADLDATAGTDSVDSETATFSDTESQSETDTGSAMDTDTVVDTGTDTGTDECHPAGTPPLVCHTFEESIPTTQDLRYGAVSLETGQVFMGGASMKSETSQINGYANVIDAFDPIETGTIYFRLHVFIPIGTVVGNTKVFNLSALGNPEVDELRGVDINVSPTRSIDIYQHGNTDRFASEPAMVPEGEWFCMKGSYTISSTAGETSVWINDSFAVSTTASADAIINGGVSETRTGIGWTEDGQNTAVMYFDNLLVDTVPVVCSTQ